ncbi:MAG: endolytic transglycosylase MltG [Deltaproteobacteria bacterium]
MFTIIRKCLAVLFSKMRLLIFFCGKDKEHVRTLAHIKPISVLLFVIAFVCITVASFYLLTSVGSQKEMVSVEIANASSLKDISNSLQEKELIKNKFFFDTLAYCLIGKRRVRSGEYEFSQSMSQTTIVLMLANGKIKTYTITIPEDWTVTQIATRLTEKKLVDYDEFMQLAKNKTFLREMKVPADSAEGYLFPKTYELERHMGEKKIMRLMINQFWREFPAPLINRAQELGLSVSETVTLASLIGKEARVANERALISAVFHNRLRMRMKLQSDPTAIYRFDEHRVIVSKRDLQRKTKYNTYLRVGLPKGPIANPGRESLLAALYPDDVDYIYFVANKNGSHNFSNNYKDHVNTINKLYKKKQRK